MVSTLTYELRELREELIELQIERGTEKKHGWVALAGRLKLLEMRRSEKWDARVADQLQEISQLLHADWFRIDADEAAQVMAAMEGLTSVHTADADAIRARVRKLRAPS